ncbi:hypothetical protein EVAR_71918_1 [Eumeta japonica]|uniref:Uncharacterized protein n=1 Tax=Eumeta variegata TaxID=151549 RepID=A0A4C1T9U7_EUMVA|nr:hypothetical protein EVAR_71918_1 [Eumeta japonica]
MLAAASSSSQQEQRSRDSNKMSLDEDAQQSERNDVHYLLKQLNSFSDIEEIEIVDMKQKQRQLLEQQPYNKEKNYIMAYNQQQHHVAVTSEQQHEERETCLNFTEYQHVERIKQQHVVDTSKSLPQHASTDQLFVLETQMQASDQTPIVTKSSEYHVDDSQQLVAVGMQTYTTESKQHYQTTAITSPTATSLVICSPSSQSHKGIRRYASQEEHAAAAVTSYHPYQHQHYHQQPHHHHNHYHVHLPHEHCSEGSMLNSAAAQAASDNPLILQQFVDDYIFQSCHYLETNNFVANYRTAMVESSSHEFRPSTTTTTRTSNEEFYEEEADYIEDHSSAHSF